MFSTVIIHLETKMAQVSAPINKLNRRNFSNWSQDIKHILMERSLWKIVTGERLPPIKDYIRDDKGQPTKLETKESLRDSEKYEDLCNQAKSLIYLHIETDYRRVIENVSSPVEAWKLLKRHFQPDSRSSEMEIITKINECKMKPDENIELFSSRLRRLTTQLLELDPDFKEKYFCYQLIRYLPPNFDSIVQSIVRWSEDKFTFDAIVDELVTEETRLRVRSRDSKKSGIDVQAVAREPKHVNFKCFKCGKIGHLKKNCKSQYNLNTGVRQPRQNSQVRNPNQVFRLRSQSRENQNRRPVKRPQNYNANFAIEASLCHSNDNHSTWVFDTAASHHCCNNRDLFGRYEPVTDDNLVAAIEGATAPILGKGTVHLKWGGKDFYLRDVAHVPNLRRNLVSGPQIDKLGIAFTGQNGCIEANWQGVDVVFKAKLHEGSYKIKFKIPKSDQKKVTFKSEVSVIENVGKEQKGPANKKICLEKWHRRFAHVNTQTIVQTSKHQGVWGLPILNNADLNCETCKLNKLKRKSFPPLDYSRTKEPLERLLADVWGPCRVNGRQGERYYLSIIDEFSRKTALYPIETKDMVTDILIAHINKAECHLGLRVKNLRSDNGGEFIGDRLKDFFLKKGIHHEFTNPYTPEQNGIVERFNQTVLNGARAMLDDSSLGLNFWPDAMITFTYTWNRLIHGQETKTPFELYEGRKPSVRHLKPFGTKTYCWVHGKYRKSKLARRAKIGFLVGYSIKTRGYKVWIPEEERVVETINVAFDEDFKGKPAEKDAHIGAVLGPETSHTPEEDDEEGEVMEYYPSTSQYQSYSEDEEDVDDSWEPRTKPEPKYELGLEDESGSESEQLDETVSLRKRSTKWDRVISERSDGSRTDVYYYEVGKPRTAENRLRSLKNIRDYCIENGIQFDPSLFNFKGKTDKFQGVVEPDVNEGSDKVMANLTQNS